MEIEPALVRELRDSLYERAAGLRDQANRSLNPNDQKAASLRGRAVGMHYAAQQIESLLAGNTAWREH